MAFHRFGIMPINPKPGERYDMYEPEKYNCIPVSDDLIEPLLEKMQAMDCFFHTLGTPAKGLAYCGITLIPPASLPGFVKLFEGQPALAPLTRLMRRALGQNCFVIHFGI